MKIRLDQLLVEKQLAPSREKAKAMIMAGQVFVAGQKETKAGHMIKAEATVEVRGERLPYVSRGGLKLKRALDVFGADPRGKICIDCGASTGGFTDCLLMHGAKAVYAVDVGYGQLDWKLRQDERVFVLERTNVRYLKPEDIELTPSFATVDVSFISLGLIFPALKEILESPGEVICLIKPQFEAGREHVGKKGVVKDPRIHQEVIERVIEKAQGAGFCLNGLDYSPIRGPEGNIEYLAYLKKQENECLVSSDKRENSTCFDGNPIVFTDCEEEAGEKAWNVAKVVEEAHENLV